MFLALDPRPSTLDFRYRARLTPAARAAGAEVDGHAGGQAVAEQPVAVFLLVGDFGAHVVDAVAIARSS